MSEFALKVVIILLSLHLSDVLKCYLLLLISVSYHAVTFALDSRISSYHELQDCHTDLLQALFLVLLQSLDLVSRQDDPFKCLQLLQSSLLQCWVREVGAIRIQILVIVLEEHAGGKLPHFLDSLFALLCLAFLFVLFLERVWHVLEHELEPLVLCHCLEMLSFAIFVEVVEPSILIGDLLSHDTVLVMAVKKDRDEFLRGIVLGLIIFGGLLTWSLILRLLVDDGFQK